MTYRRKHRWLRRLALGLAFATFAAPAAARPDEGGAATSAVVTAGGWTGPVDAKTGIPLSAGIPKGNEQFVDDQSIQVIPYLSHGILTEADQAAAVAGAVQDPYLTDVFVRQGESLGGPDGDELTTTNALETLRRPDGDELAIKNALELQASEPFVAGVTDFPTATVVEQPQVISYLSHGMTAETEGVAWPDNKADRFSHSDVAPSPEPASSGSATDWDGVFTLGIGAVVLALALGFGFGFVKRPRLAGL